MSSSRFGKHRLAAAACVAAMVTAAAACSSGGGSSASGNNSSTGTVTVAVVSNPLITGQMIPLTKSVFEKQNPGITVKFVTYTEGDLRAAIEKDVSTHSNSFNAVMIGPYEAPLFAKNNWLVDLTKQYIGSDPSYDAADLLPPVAKSLSSNGDLYASPFYGESSMLYYNKVLLKAAGVTLPLHPTWMQVQAAAAKLNQPGKVSGICLRGLAGWGDNMAALDTVINTFGGQWYNENWQAQLNSPATTQAVNFYVNLVKQYGEPGASNDSFNQLLTLYGQGKCAMWYDATVAATSIATTYPSVFAQTGYAFAPTEKTSLYANPNYKKAASAFADITLQSINGTDPEHPTVNKVPYVGIQYVDVPQFETLGLTVGQQIAGAIAGTESVSQALSTAQSAASAYTPQQLSGSN
jgi:sorbitol/mannitol transport system substrate-binding protein